MNDYHSPTRTQWQISISGSGTMMQMTRYSWHKFNLAKFEEINAETQSTNLTSEMETKSDTKIAKTSDKSSDTLVRS